MAFILCAMEYYNLKIVIIYLAQDVRMDLKLSRQGGYRSPYFREYVLPDGVNNFRGYIRVSNKQCVRFVVVLNTGGHDLHYTVYHL